MSKCKKKMKYGFFKVSRKINNNGYGFKYQEELMLNYKFNAPNCTQTQ